MFNKYYFKDLSDYEIRWSVYENGTATQAGILKNINAAARKRTQFSIPFDTSKLKENAEYFVKIQYLLKEKQPWADKEFVQAEEQFLLQEASKVAGVAEASKAANASKPVLENEKDGLLPKTFEKQHPKLRFSSEEGIFCKGSDDPWRIKKIGRAHV